MRSIIFKIGNVIINIYDTHTHIHICILSHLVMSNSL